jgi:hypothetical protein
MTTAGAGAEDGPMLTAVKADLANLGEVTGGARRTYAAMALWLATVIDKRGQEDGPSVTARLATELRATMAALTRTDTTNAEGIDELLRALSIPARP